MRRLAALLVLAAACADSSGAMPSTIGVPDTTNTTPSAVPTVPEGSTTTSPPDTEACTTGAAEPEPSGVVDTDRELAPNFTLALGDGSCYTLSEGAKPVYLVFWAEWCPVCRRELPVVDRVADEYSDRVDFVAPAWKSGEEAAVQAAASLFQSGRIMWGLDPEEIIFGLYQVPYQPVTVLIAADRTVVEAWAGVRSEERIRTALDELLALSS